MIGKELLDKQALDKTSLEPILRRSIIKVAEAGNWNRAIEELEKSQEAKEKSVKEAEGALQEEIVSLFLLTPEVEEIVRQIYSTKLASGDRENLSAIRQIFFTLFAQFVSAYPSSTGLKEETLNNAAKILIEFLIVGCDQSLDHAINIGILSAHEARSSYRHNILLSEIKAIQRKLEFFSPEQQPDITSILEFEKRYRQQVGSRHDYITPPNLDTVRPLPIDTLYVYPRFFAVRQKGGATETLGKDEFFSRIYRAALLRKPRW